MPEIERPSPPYLQVARHIRDQIVRGELAPGDAVPSVREIAAGWGIARATAEKALLALRTQGLVEARPGSGTVVRGNPPIYRTAQDRYATVRQTGRIYTAGEHAQIRAAEQIPAPDDVATALQVPAGSPVVRRHRVTYLGDTPVSSSTSWFTAKVGATAPKLLTAERILEGTSRYVEQATGRAVRYAQEHVAARLATAEEAAELGRAEPLAVLETLHTAWDGDNQPITYEVGLAQAGYQVTYSYEVDRESEDP
jgi:DNA-binding GntR family transcriptional regulator